MRSRLKATQQNRALPLDEVALYGARVHAVVPADERSRGSVCQTLRANDIPITSLEWIGPTLEDAFIAAVRASRLTP